MSDHGFTRSFKGTQVYRYRCTICGADAMVPGTHSGPHDITRIFRPIDPWQNCNYMDRVWRYSCEKHGVTAWYDMTRRSCDQGIGGIGDSVQGRYPPVVWPDP